jgi:hypothetical protein
MIRIGNEFIDLKQLGDDSSRIVLSEEEIASLSQTQRNLFSFYQTYIRTKKSGCCFMSEQRMEISGTELSGFVPHTRKSIARARHALTRRGFIFAQVFYPKAENKSDSIGRKRFCITLPRADGTFDREQDKLLRTCLPFLANMEEVPDSADTPTRTVTGLSEVPTRFNKLPSPSSLTPSPTCIEETGLDVEPRQVNELATHDIALPPDFSLFEKFTAEYLNAYVELDPCLYMELFWLHRIPTVLCCRPVFGDKSRNCTMGTHQWSLKKGRWVGTGCDSPGKRPAYGYKNRLLEKDFKHKMLSRLAKAPQLYNIALVPPASMVVLDFDDKDPSKNGFASLEHLTRSLGSLPPTVVHQSGGGSPHLMFATNSTRILNNEAAPGIDIRTGATGKPSLIILSGLHIGGRVNRFESTGNVAPLPAKWEAYLEVRVARKATAQQNSAAPETIDTGQGCLTHVPLASEGRHIQLRNHAVSMRYGGRSAEEIRERLQTVNRGFDDGGKPDCEIERIIDWVMNDMKLSR